MSNPKFLNRFLRKLIQNADTSCYFVETQEGNQMILAFPKYPAFIWRLFRSYWLDSLEDKGHNIMAVSNLVAAQVLQEKGGVITQSSRGMVAFTLGLIHALKPGEDEDADFIPLVNFPEEVEGDPMGLNSPEEQS